MRLEDGHYVITIDGQTCELEVADTFHVVSRVEFSGDTAAITLNDGTSEPLDPATLRMGDNGILYCQVKGRGLPGPLRPGGLLPDRGAGRGFRLGVGGQDRGTQWGECGEHQKGSPLLRWPSLFSRQVGGAKTAWKKSRATAVFLGQQACRLEPDAAQPR